jgi:hypothetical protein
VKKETDITVLFPFALGETEAYFKTVHFIFLINVLDEGLEVFNGFIVFGCHNLNNYSINTLG